MYEFNKCKYYQKVWNLLFPIIPLAIIKIRKQNYKY